MAVIFYLSGSGNSLYVAQRIAKSFDDCRLESVGSYLRNPYEVEDKIVGIVCPVYCFTLPPVMVEFINALRIRPIYTFGVVTMGGNQGRALKNMSELLKEKGVKLNYGATLLMPDNFFGVPKERQIEVLEKSEKILDVICSEIKNTNTRTLVIQEAWLWKAFGIKFAWWYLNNVTKVGEMNVDCEKCVSCGICESVCSMKNIKMEDGKPVFGDKCAHCLGCLHWCPQSAISAGKIKVDAEKRYMHPKIDLAMMKENIDEEG